MWFVGFEKAFIKTREQTYFVYCNSKKQLSTNNYCWFIFLPFQENAVYFAQKIALVIRSVLLS